MAEKITVNILDDMKEALKDAAVHERDIMAHSRHDSASTMRCYIRAALAPGAFTSAVLWNRVFEDG